MLSTYPGLDIGKLTASNFNELFNQALNITGWKLSGKLELETMRDKKIRAREQFKEIKNA